MGTAATRAKRKWNSTHYTNVTAAMKQELAVQFKERCKENGVSVTSVISELVAEYLGTEAATPKDKPQKKAPDNRNRRRRALWECIAAIEELQRGEEEYFNNIPENLHGSIRYVNAKNSAEHFRMAIDELKEVYPEGS